MTHAAAPTLSVDNLSALAVRKQSQLLDKYPQYQAVFTDPSETPSKPSQPTTVWQAVVDQLKPSLEVTEVVKSELASVFEKLTQAISDPTLLSDNQLRLYMEQQLTDLLGISVSSEINQTTLPLWQGVIEALPHSSTAADHTLSSHGQILEAGLSPFRYELPAQLQQQPTQDAEQYAILYPVWLHEDFVTNPSAVLKQYCAHQFLLINPLQKRIIVAHCIGQKSPSYRYALAGSPEVIRQGRFWWPSSNGQLICFALTNQTTTGLLYAE